MSQTAIPPSSRDALQTPALILDLDALEHNASLFVDMAATAGCKLRPHGKTHKCSWLAKQQLAGGAIGLCCAKVSEAEAFSRCGIAPVLVTSPVVSEEKVARALNAFNDCDLMMVTDEISHARALSNVASASGRTLNILVDLDVGLHRTGVRDTRHALELARFVSELPGMALRGIQAYAGHIQHIEDYVERERAAHDVLKRVREAKDLLLSEGLACEVVTGSGTGTAEIDARADVFTDLQVGSYLFSDSHYREVRLFENRGQSIKDALFIQTQVISANHPGFVTTDAGSESFALDGRPPVICRGAPADSRYSVFGDQFGRITLGGNVETLPIGRRVEVLTSHCDPTVNLYDVIHCVRGNDVVDVIPVDGRGSIR